MEKQKLIEWPENQFGLKEIFDKITDEFGSPDVNFRSGSRNYKVHKKVLEKHSSVMKAKLSDVWHTSGDVFQLNEEYVEPEVVEELLEWMYYKSAKKYRFFSTENAYSLCVAAHYLMISELVTSCCHELQRQIGPDNIYEIWDFSKHLNLDFLRQNCLWSIANKPAIVFSSPRVVEWKIEELKMFIKESVMLDKTPKARDLILLSLPIWISSIEERFPELENLLKLVPPETLSSDALFRFMGTELYSRLDELHRKQYYVRSYLPTGINSTYKLYCISQPDAREFYKIHSLDLSTGGKWGDFQSEFFVNHSGLGAAWKEKIYFFEYNFMDRFIKVFSTETGEWDSSKSLNDHNIQMLAAVASDDYIYVTDSNGLYCGGKRVSRYCIETKRWETLEDMQVTRLKHQLVALDGFVYAIGGETSFERFSFRLARDSDQDPRPERYNPQTDQWDYIALSNFRHELPAAVAHGGQIYVLSKAGFEAYFPRIERWTRLPLPKVCIKPSLVSIAGKLWLMTDSVRCPNVRLVYEFDVVKQGWTRLPDLPKGYYTDLAFVIKQ